MDYAQIAVLEQLLLVVAAAVDVLRLAEMLAWMGAEPLVFQFADMGVVRPVKILVVKFAIIVAQRYVTLQLGIMPLVITNVEIIVLVGVPMDVSIIAVLDVKVGVALRVRQLVEDALILVALVAEVVQIIAILDVRVDAQDIVEMLVPLVALTLVRETVAKVVVLNAGVLVRLVAGELPSNI